MHKPLEVVIICMTGVMCEAIADAIECDRITITALASSVSGISDNLLTGKTIVYVWGGGDESFAEHEAALLSECNALSWVILSENPNNAIVERLMADGRSVSTAPLDICRQDLRHLIYLAERNHTISVGTVCESANAANAAAGQFLRRANLDPNQIALLQYLSNGLSNKEIAREWDCTEGSVKVHIRQLMLKLGVSNRTQAAVLAVRAGLSTPEGDVGALSTLLQQSEAPARANFQDRPFSASRPPQLQVHSAPPHLPGKRSDQDRLAS